MKFIWRLDEIKAYEAEKAAKELAEREADPPSWDLIFELLPLVLTVAGISAVIYIAFHFIHKYW